MNKEEYIKFVKENEKMNRSVKIAALLATIRSILIKEKICSAEVFDKTEQIYTEKLIEAKYEAENKEDLENVKKIKEFLNMFGVK